MPKLVGTCPLLRLLSPLAPWVATFAALTDSIGIKSNLSQQRSGTYFQYTTVLQMKSVRQRVRKEMSIRPSLPGIDQL
jgi:hypothetical protein